MSKVKYKWFVWDYTLERVVKKYVHYKDAKKYMNKCVIKNGGAYIALTAKELKNERAAGSAVIRLG